MDATQQDSDPQTVLNFAMSSFSNLIDNKLEHFTRTMSQQSGSNVDEAVRRAKRETFVCKSKGNQQQLEHCLKVLEKLEDATTFLDNNAVDSVKRKLEEGTDIMQKLIKAIKIAYKSDYGWATVTEYLSDELASDTEDEKRLYRSEKRAEKKYKDRQRLRKQKFAKVKTPQSFSVTSSIKGIAGPHKLGPCFKVGYSLYFTCFVYLRACIFILSLTRLKYNVLNVFCVCMCLH